MESVDDAVEKGLCPLALRQSIRFAAGPFAFYLS